MDSFLHGETFKMLYDIALIFRTVLYAGLSLLMMWLSMYPFGVTFFCRCLGLFFAQTLLVTASAIWFPGLEMLFRALLVPVLIACLYSGLRLARSIRHEAAR